MAQAIHAAIQFTQDYPDEARDWYKSSNYLVVINTPNEDTLRDLWDRSRQKRIESSLVSEPDLNGQLTAMALEPGEKSRKLCACLPLAFRDTVPSGLRKAEPDSLKVTVEGSIPSGDTQQTDQRLETVEVGSRWPIQSSTYDNLTRKGEGGQQ